MEVFETNSPEQTQELGGSLARRLCAGDCVALIGPLGAGKTVLVRGIAMGLGVRDARIVSSPTFVLVKEYAGRVVIRHVDLYRLTDPAVELMDLGIDEMLRDGVVLIEWADRAPDALPLPRWEIRIEVTGESTRRFHLKRTD